MLSVGAKGASSVLRGGDLSSIAGIPAASGSARKQGLTRSAREAKVCLPSGKRSVGSLSCGAFPSTQNIGFKGSQIAPYFKDVQGNKRGSQVCSLNATENGAAAETNPYSDSKNDGGDVYVTEEEPTELELQKLKGGVRRQTISVYVVDERGLINRVAGVFARRGFNIESLAVGLWGKQHDRALFTVSVLSDDSSIKALVKQIYKLPNVRKVRLVTDLPTVERGLVLFKVKVADAASRTQLVETCGIFRANVVDVSDNSMIIAMTGDPGKHIALQRYLQKFGIIQIARTGKVALRRELREESLRTKALMATQDDLGNSRDDGEDTRNTWDELQMEGPLPLESQELGIYSSGSQGDWLDIFESDFAEGLIADTGMQPGLSPHTVSILVDNMTGVLDRVTGVVARRGYNVQSLAVGPGEKRGVSRITMVIPGTDKSVEALLRQLRKLVSVLDATDLTGTAFVERELCLIKVLANRTKRSEIIEIADIFRAKVSDISRETLVLEVVGDAKKTTAMVQMLSEFGIVEVARTGRVALARESGIDSRLLNQLEMDTFF